jgi:hypothetical protein
MGYSFAAKNSMLDHLGTEITYVGLFTGGTAVTGVTGVAATDLMTKASHGLTNGDLVAFTSLTGGAGLVTNTPYWVVGVNGNDFQVSSVSAGAAIDFTSTLTDATIKKLTEITGGNPAYARIAIAWSAAALGILDDSTNGAAINVPAAGVVSYVGFFSALSTGTLYGIDDVTEETFAAQGTYTVTDAKLNLNA